MYKQLKEDLLRTLMKKMGSVIDTLDEHSKSIKKLEQRISQLSVKSSDVKERKDVEFSLEDATPETRGADGEYCKFLDSEHPGAYVIAILKSPYEKGKAVMCHALLVHEQNGVELLYVSDDTLSAPRSNCSRGFCNLICKNATFYLRETYKEADLTVEDVNQINDYIKKVGYMADFNVEVFNTPFHYSVSARLTRPFFKTSKHRYGKQKNK
jgi:hypothetical protein